MALFAVNSASIAWN